MNVLKEIKVLNEKMFYLLLYSVAFRTLSLPTTQQMTMNEVFDEQLDVGKVGAMISVIKRGIEQQKVLICTEK